MRENGCRRREAEIYIAAAHFRRTAFVVVCPRKGSAGLRRLPVLKEIGDPGGEGRRSESELTSSYRTYGVSG